MLSVICDMAQDDIVDYIDLTQSKLKMCSVPNFINVTGEEETADQLKIS